MPLFVKQHGVAGTAQLKALAVSDEAVRRARRCELVVTVLPGVVGVSSACGSIESRAMAVQLAASGAGFTGGISAGRLRADQDRDRACGEVGWMVARFDESLRERRPAIVRQLRSIYTTRRRQLAPAL